MNKDNLYKIAEKDGICIDFFNLPQTSSVSIEYNGKYYIGIDTRFCGRVTKERVLLAHELGHCKTAAFYNMYSPFENREKYEKKADKWAINYLVPRDRLKKAIKQGNCCIPSLAQYFDVTEEFMEKALKYYTFG